MKVYVKENPFIEFIKNRVKRNKNCLIIIVGETGSGKSYGGLRLLEVLDPTFNIDRVAFSGKEFLEIIMRKDLKHGNGIMLDEAGISMDARTWWSTHNRLINLTLQTFRYRRLICVFTCPQLNFIDKKAIPLFKIIMQSTGIDTSKKVSIFKPFIIQPNPVSIKDDKDFYRQYPVTKTSDGIAKIKRLWLHLPRKELRKKYEEKKQPYMAKLYAAAGRDFSYMENKGISVTNAITDRERKVHEVIESNPNKTGKELSEQLGITTRMFYIHKKNLKKKGLIKNKKLNREMN